MQFLQIFIDIWNVAIIQPMINSLVLLYSVFFLNFGLAIIAFTLIVRLILIPLTVRQSRQMMKMTALQPQLKELQEKHKDDRQTLSRRTMEVYKANGVNPIGCLGPLFIQFPIWIGLFQAVIQTLPSTPERLVGLSGHLYPWLPGVHDVIPINNAFLWLDLAQPDSLPVMPVLVGVSMWLMQKTTTLPSADPRQASTNRMMLWMMPIMFGFFTTTFPSGLALYWVVSNLVGMIIQGFVTGWGPLTDMLKFNRGESAPTPVPAGASASAVAPASPESEETPTNADDRNNGKNTRRGNRNRARPARRRSRRGGNRRR
ncbi:MAG: YidC/Oxa1 family membrane protein insertase [Chloroflexota bacterium]|nr:YidC/Oxa1 family membrane protein insertase [Chloroflexota bacterium]MDE2686223.1 YidC/Oxa1 family membrane protein insertase [Chloroflexota bacterium]MYC05867.1 membrane protein insertase YidC [Chloroflexota bacterium]